MKLPNVKKPCKDCPFRTDCMRGWLGKKRITEILSANSFTCHKTNDPNRLQCVGHMIIKGTENEFVRLANQLGFDLELSGHELIFKSESELIKHHS